MSNFGGRLTLSRTGSCGDQETSVLFCVPVERGAGCSVGNGLGGILDLSFITGATDMGPSYSVSALPANQIYDVWMTGVGGIAVIGLLAWSMTKAFGAGAFGGGIFGNNPEPAVKEISYFGVPVNGTAMTLRMGDGSSLSVPQYTAHHVGSIAMSDTAGVLKCHTMYNLNREWDVWNRYHQTTITLKGGSSPYETGLKYLNANYFSDRDWSLWLNDPTLSGYLRAFAGRPSPAKARFVTSGYQQAWSGYASIVQSAIGWDSQSVPSGTWGAHSFESFAGAGQGGAAEFGAEFLQPSFSAARKVWPLVKIQGVAPGSIVNNGTSNLSLWGNELRGGASVEWLA